MLPLTPDLRWTVVSRYRDPHESRSTGVFCTEQCCQLSDRRWFVAAGCLEIAEEFRSQEIDGQALLLLKEDHLMGTMNIKLGPALKIFAQINMLKDS